MPRRGALSDKLAMHAARIALAVLLPWTIALPAAGQVSDPLKSPACGAALSSLQSARQGGAGTARVEALRSEAASTCLGSGVAPSRPSRTLQAPIVVPPPQIEVAPVPPPLAPPSLPPPPVAIERPPVPATCDPSGCWTNDGGTHLRHVPPNLVGPRGLCSTQAGVVYCP